MNAKVVRVGEAARRPAMRGIDMVADLVAGTMGPAGRAVLVGRNHAPPLLLRNGYAITQNLELEQRDEQVGVLLMRELAWRVSDAVGDGTSSAVLAARAVARAGGLASLAGIAQTELQSAIDAHCRIVLEALEAASRPAPDGAMLERLASQAVGGDAALGALLAEAHVQAGRDGMVIVEEGRSVEDSLRFDAGLHFDQGWISPHLVDDARTRTIEIENPLILLHAGAITALEPIVRVLEMIAQAQRGIVIIAEAVTDAALTTLIANKRRAGLKVAAIKAPGAGTWRRSMLEDIAIATGGTLIAEEQGYSLAALRPGLMGGAARAIVRRDGSTIIGGKGDPAAIQARTAAIRDAIVREKHLGFDREQHRKRLARLQAGIATLGIGGRTASHLQLRLEQARSASATLAAARAGGLVQGGSAALLHAARTASSALPGGLLGQLVGRMFAAATQAPLRAIVHNAGEDADLIVARIASGSDLTFDARSRNLVPAEGIMDPASVAIAAFRGAVSTASRFLAIGASLHASGPASAHGQDR
jgi:chaperonin GroEL